MRYKKYFSLVSIIVVFGISAYGYALLIEQPFFVSFLEWAQQYFLIYFFVLSFLKIIALVWPPLPGRVFTLASIPIIGWFPAYLADSIGGVIGDSITYFLGKRYGYPLLNKLFDKEAVAKLRKVKLKKDRELEAVVVLNVFYGIVSEVISYGSGLIGVRYRNFLAASIVAALFNIPVFYFVDLVLERESVFLAVIGISLALLLFYKFKGRYFE